MIPAAGRRPAIDRRLFGLGRGARPFLAAAIVLGLAGAGLAIARAVLLARLVAGGFAGTPIRDLAVPLAGLLGVAGAAALVAWLTEVAAHHSAAGVKSSLRRSLLAQVAARAAAGERAGALAAAAGRGIEALDTYFARYLPQLALAVAVPLFVIGWMFPLDPWSAVIVAVTLPLIPVFGALVGAATRARVAHRWQAFSDLSAGFVESLRSLPTLKLFGRSRERVEAFSALSERHRRETMGTLRIAFLSAFVLELAATISVAVVAVAVGLRVLDGGLGLEAGLTVLLLAPEAYLAPRRLAAEFHASAEGVAAAAEILDYLEAPSPPAPARPPSAAPARPAPITLEDLTVVYPGRALPALERLSLHIADGEYLAVAGPSGSGKSTLLAVLAGLVAPTRGRVIVAGSDLASLDLAGWRRLLAWVPQSPRLFHGTIADNVRFGAPSASDEEVRRALEAAAAGFVDDLPEGIRTLVGEGGALLSAGERTRIALARALVRRAPLLLLDEPAAHLDPLTELAVLDSLDRLHGTTTIVLAGHRPEAAARADRVLRLDPGHPPTGSGRTP